MTAVAPDRGQGAVRATAICWLPPGATMGKVARGLQLVTHLGTGAWRAPHPLRV